MDMAMTVINVGVAAVGWWWLYRTEVRAFRRRRAERHRLATGSMIGGPAMTITTRGGLDGPSRTITVEPVQLPDPTPEREAPAEPPAQPVAPEREPVKTEVAALQASAKRVRALGQVVAS